MLVLTRKKNDSIVIDGRILVEVLQIKGNGIRLGISAPADVSILRGELKPFGVAREGQSSEVTNRQQTLSLYADDPSSGDPLSGARRPDTETADDAAARPTGLRGRLANRKPRW